MAGPSLVAPVSRRFIAVGKETTPGTAVAPTATLPMTTFDPEDKVTGLMDESWRNAMAQEYAYIQGVESGDLSMGGPVYGDTLCYPLLSITGDYWQSVVGTAGSATTLASAYTAGGTTISVTSNTGLTTGAYFAVGTLASTAEEVRTVASITGSGPYTVTLSSPMYQSHASSAAVTPYSAVTGVVHNFSLLNAGTGAGGTLNAQCPTYTWYDYTSLTTTVGARCYPFTRVSEMSLTGSAEALLMWDAKGMSYVSQPAASTPTASVSGVFPQADWHTQVGIGGTVSGSPINDVKSWKTTLTRKTGLYYTNDGSQNPYTIGQGALAVAGTLTFDPSYDESQLLNFLNNTQPQLQIIANNGLTGTSAIIVTINVQTAAYNTGKITDSAELFGHDIAWKGIAGTTNSGPSGGYSPIQISIQNAITAY